MNTGRPGHPYLSAIDGNGDDATPPPGMPTPRLKFRRSQRLGHARDYQAILKGRMSRPSGPLVVHARAGTTGSHRLGLSVGRRVGVAVVRNRIKRRLREAFRHVCHALPRTRTGEPLDFVVAVRPHEPLDRAEYEQLLVSAAVKLVAELDRRAARGTDARP